MQLLFCFVTRQKSRKVRINTKLLLQNKAKVVNYFCYFETKGETELK